MRLNMNNSKISVWKQYYPILKMRILNRQAPILYDLNKFGFTPGKIYRRLFAGSELPRILLISIPKSGINLLERALCLHPHIYRIFMPVITPEHLIKRDNIKFLLEKMKPGELMLSHLTYTSERAREIAKSGVKIVMMIRNPRDIVISRIFYATRFLGHKCHDVFKNLHDFESKIKLSIVGDNSLGVDSIRTRLEDFEPWLDNADCVVRFEDLIGARGGGSNVRQMEQLKNIYNSIGVVEVSDEILHHIYKGVFDTKSPTFYKGLINQGKNSFDNNLEELFVTHVGTDLLEQYGY